MTTDSVYIGNRGGIPVITATPTVGTSNVIITLPNHIFRYAGSKGMFIINLTAIITSGTTTTFPVLAQTNNTTLAFTNETGADITVSDMANTLTFVVYFDKSSNTLRIISSIL